MAKELDLNPAQVQELEKAQEKDVRESQVANPLQEKKVEINLMTSLILTPPFKVISPIELSNGSDKEHPIYSMGVTNDVNTLVFKGSATKLRLLKANLLQAMQQGSIYVVDVDNVLENEDSLIYSYH